MGAAGWEDRAASALLRYLLGRAIDEDLVFRRVKGGFKVFRAYSGVETRVDELKIGKVARSKAGEEELRRFMEEARRMAPDLSGLDKAPQYLEWLVTEVSSSEKRIVAGTAHLWQAAWYIALLGKEKLIRGRANVTEEGRRPNVAMHRPREREDRILRESRCLESLLDRRVESWRELIDAIDWSWVLKRVEELDDELKPWIGPEKASDVEREGLVRRMLGELALLTHFAEAGRGMDGGRWREERVKRLAKAVEALSGGRIAGDHADRLAKLIIRYAEGHKKEAEERIENLAGEVGVSREEVWGIVNRISSGKNSDVYCLAKDCAGDRIVRRFVAPALELIVLEKALDMMSKSKDEELKERIRKETLLWFGEMYATAIAGDGSVRRRSVELAVGGELGGGAALLRLATLHLINQLQPDELKFGMRTYVRRGVYSRNRRKCGRFYAPPRLSAPSAGGEYLSKKFNEFVKETRVEVQLDKDSIRRTKKGRVAADLAISEAGVAVKYNAYLHDAIVLEFGSTDRNRVELAARLLKLAGIGAEMKKVGDGNEWRVITTTRKLAAGRGELRKALAEIVRKAVERDWVDASKAEGWLEKLEKGRVLKEGWPEYLMRLAKGALVVRFASPNSDSIKREAQRLRDMGLKEGRHFTVKMPEEGRDGYVYIRREGLAHAARLSVRGKDKQQRKLAADFVKYILERAEKEGKEVSEKAQKIIEEGMSRGSLKLKDFEMEVEVNGEKHKVKVIDGEAVEENRGGKKLLRIRITAEVGGALRDYKIKYGRYDRNAAKGSATAKADDAERFSALIKALTGRSRGYTA